MKTYFVRTRFDQSLVGIFCASSSASLATIIEDMVDPLDCEYLILKANEGLFVEANFAHAPSADGSVGTVFLTNTPDEILGVDEDELGDAEEALEARGGSNLRRAMEEVIPPVLEPTEALHTRIQAEEHGGWVPFEPGAEKPQTPARQKTKTPIIVSRPMGRMH